MSEVPMDKVTSVISMYIYNVVEENIYCCHPSIEDLNNFSLKFGNSYRIIR